MKRLVLLILIIIIIGVFPALLGSVWGFIDFEYHCDFLWQEVPFIIEIKRLISTGTPLWSWNTFLGDNFVGAYSYYGLFSPFVWLCCLFPVKYIWTAILLSFCLKILCTGFFSAAYFRRMGISDRNVIIGALLYTFSSFSIINNFYGMFAEAVMLYPLLLIGIENVLDRRRRSFRYLALLTFIIVCTQYYMAFQSVLCCVIYLLCRILWDKDYHNFRSFLYPVMAMFYGIAMSAVVIFPVLYHIVGSGRDEIVFPLFSSAWILDFVGKLFWAVVPKISEARPSSFFSGSLGSVSLYIQVFGLSGAIVYAAKIKDWLSRCLMILAVFYFTYLTGIFTFFTSYTYSRWGYCFILLLILSTLRVLDGAVKLRIHDIFNYVAFSSGIVLIVVILRTYFCWRSSVSFALNGRETTELLLFMISSIALIWLYHKNFGLKYTLAVITVMSSLSLLTFTLFLSGQFTDSDNFIGNDSDYGSRMVVNNSYVMRDFKCDTMNYRTDFRCQYLNMGLLKNTPSITSFHSLYNKKVLRFKNVVSDPSWNVETVFKAPRASIAALLSVKDIVYFKDRKLDGSDYNGNFLNKTNSQNDFSIYSFECYIPVGMFFDTYVLDTELSDYINIYGEDADVPLMMLDNIVLSQENAIELNDYLEHKNLNPKIKLDSICSVRRQNVASHFSGTSKGYALNIDAPSRGVVFISVPCDDGFKVRVDGKEAKIYSVNLGLSGIAVEKGKHEITATYMPPGLKSGACITVLLLLLLVINPIIESWKCCQCRQASSGR